MTNELKKGTPNRSGGSATSTSPATAADQAREVAIGLSAALNVAGLLAAPRLLATALRAQEDAPTGKALSAMLDHALTAFRAESDPTGLFASLSALRGHLLTWEGGSPAPEPIVATARKVLRTLNIGEPDEGWDHWDGHTVEQTTPPVPATPRILRAEPMTVEEWLAWSGPGELCDGVLVEGKASTALEDAVAAWFLMVLRAWASPRGGLVYGREHKLIVSDATGRKPDACVYMAGDAITAQEACSAPMLVLEVVPANPTDSRRARLAAWKEYAALGVRWYWIVDALRRTLEMLELDPGGRYTLFLAADEGVMSEVGPEGLILDLDALWAATATMRPGTR